MRKKGGGGGWEAAIVFLCAVAAVAVLEVREASWIASTEVTIADLQNDALVTYAAARGHGFRQGRDEMIKIIDQS